MSDRLPVTRRGDVGGCEAVVDARRRFAGEDVLARTVIERVADGTSTWSALRDDLHVDDAVLRPALQTIIAADPWWATGPYCLR